MEDAKRRALAGAAELLPRQLALLERICSLDSGTGNEAGNAAVIELLLPVLAELGAQVERVTEPGLGTHLVARIRPEQPRGKALLAAHLDTVFGPGFAEKHPCGGFCYKGENHFFCRTLRSLAQSRTAHITPLPISSPERANS